MTSVQYTLMLHKSITFKKVIKKTYKINQHITEV
jgi:hypothetical protein